MIRTTSTVLVAATAVALSGCGVGNDAPLVGSSEITLVAATDTTITISWSPAANEPNLGKGFVYEVYTSATTMASADGFDSATLQLSGGTSELGDDPTSATISGLSAGTGYHINVAVVNPRSGDLDLYDDILGITSGGQVVTDVYTGTNPYFNHDVGGSGGSGASVAIEYTIELGATISDVYLVFSNPGATSIARPEIVLGSLSEVGTSMWSAANYAQVPILTSRSVMPTGPIVLRDRPEIAGWQAPAKNLASRTIASPPPPPLFDTLGPLPFYDDSTSNVISATNRAIVSDGAMTLNIWVEDSEWDMAPTPLDGKINQTMVDFLADSFLTAFADNDIFDWLTNIYGVQWGPHGFSNLIDETNANEITILLWNIGNDGAGGVVGYFWSKDNFVAGTGPGEVDYSNERVMFYLDSESLGTRKDETWDTTDYWPTVMVATLAHEFQHMVHYYQRDVRQNAHTQTWLNEMMSMVTEDLVANNLYAQQAEIDIAGPRGVAPSWSGGFGGAGDPDNDLGRLPLYGANPSISLTTWLPGNSVLKSYAIAYAFGAFISRNFGGAQLLQNMMSSGSNNSETVISLAIGASGGPVGLTMGDLLWRWGTSVLLSDDTLAPDRFRMNTGSWISSTVGTTYDLGSVNHFYYNQEGLLTDGPEIHSVADYSLSEMSGISNIFYELALNQNGSLTAVLLVPTGVDFTVVVK